MPRIITAARSSRNENTQANHSHSDNAPGHLRGMATQILSPAQQAQLDNRGADGKWKQKTHTGVEDSADVLGLDADTQEEAPRSETQRLADSYVEDPELAESFRKFSDHFDQEMVATAQLYASRRLASRGDMTDPMHDSEDLAQDAMVNALEQMRSKGADSIKHPKSWLYKNVEHRSHRMGEGKYHWPNSVALSLYNDEITEFEQSNGRSMTRSEKTAVRDEILTNWDEIRPTMTRHRPQPDFDRHTEKSRAVRIDHLDHEGTGSPHSADAFLNANHTKAQRDEGVDSLAATISGKNRKATDEQVRAASAAGWAYLAAEHDAPPVVEGSVSPAYAREYERTFGDDGSGVVEAIDQWEAGEENEQTAAIFAPFREKGAGGLSRTEESAVVDTLTARGKTPDKAGRVWKLALDGARR